MTAVQRKPGILFIGGLLPPPYGGIAKFMHDWLPYLASEGYEVWACMRRRYSTHDYSAYERLGVHVVLPPDVSKWHPRTWWRMAVTLTRYAPSVFERVVKYKMPLREALVLLFIWFPEVEDVLRANQHRIDIIHALDQISYHGWVAMLLGKRYGKRLYISTFGNLSTNANAQVIDQGHRQRLPFLQHILSHYDRIISMTDYCGSLLQQLGIDAARVDRLNFVMNLDVFATRPALDVDAHYPHLRGKRVILFVGQLHPRKSPQTLMQIARRVVDAALDVHFVFVGEDFGQLPLLQQIATQDGVSDSCTFTGGVSEEMLRALYHRASMFVFTTTSPIECLGLVWVQALFAGVPVVAVKISATSEVLTHERDALLYPAGDANVLLAQVRRLLDDPALAAALVEHGRRLAEQHFSNAAVFRQTRALYLGAP
jgi:glycosyltransferase involved in cell wall biosynthesis